MRKNLKRKFAFLIMLIMLFSVSTNQVNKEKITIYATVEEEDHYYSQKGWTYNGKTLTSMCYITSYAMILRNMGKDVNPVDVYIANGCSNYVVHSKIASAYNVNTSETSSINSKSVKEKQEFIKELLKKYPQGIIVGGSYGSGTHYIVAKKVVDDEILFDDPAIGCCVPISKVYKHTWETLDMYRIIKDVSIKPTATIKPTSSAELTVTTKPSTNPAKTTKPTTTVKPTTKPVTTIKPTSTIKPTIKPTITAKPTTKLVETITPIITVKPADTSIPSSAITSNVKNPLNKYKVPTRTIYYKKKNMTGEDVKWVELAFKTLKYSITIDGKYTTKDKNIVKKYQKKKGLPPDGYFGKNTRQKVLSDLEIALTKVNQVTGLSIKKGTTSSSISVASNSSNYQVTANWKKVTDADGYQLVYSSKKDFSEKKSITKTGKSAVIKNLKDGTKYYIKVRAYKIVHNTKVYGTYSSVKTVKL